jgi:hypothetical protein
MTPAQENTPLAHTQHLLPRIVNSLLILLLVFCHHESFGVVGDTIGLGNRVAKVYLCVSD